MSIVINLEKCRLIAHDRRRAARDAEIAPLDLQIARAIPGVDLEAVEAARQAVRDKYAQIQIQIDQATTVEEIKAALAGI